MTPRQYAAAFLWICLLIGLIATACSAIENPPTVKISVPFGAPAGTSSFTAPTQTISLCGVAGVSIPGVRHADLSNWATSQAGFINLNVTQAAEQAVIKTKCFEGCIGNSGTLYVNGFAVNYDAADSIYQLCEAIGRVFCQSGVAARVDSGIINLISYSYGSKAMIMITNGADILPNGESSMVARGKSALMQVTNSAGEPITDALWEAVDGLNFYDSHKNKIELYEAANSVREYSSAIEMTDQQIDHVTWCNTVTGENGTCTGTKAWYANDIHLAGGDNEILVAATDVNGLTSIDWIYITYFPRFQINYPAETCVYTDKNTVDLIGETNASAVITGTAVVASDFPGLPTSTPVNTYLDINVVQAAQKAKLITNDFGENDEACIGSAGTLNLNGVEIEYSSTTTVAELRDKINLHSAETKVVAVSDDGEILLSSMNYGSTASIAITNVAGLMPGGWNSIAVIGVDVRAIVTCADGSNITDAVWSSGSGFVLEDTYRDTIELTPEAALSCGAYSHQINLTADEIRWSNDLTKESGICTRSLLWNANGIKLLPGDNDIHVSSTSASGKISTDDLLVKYFEPKTLSAAKQMEDGSFVSLERMVVTADGFDITYRSGTVYVEQLNRISGIKVFYDMGTRGYVYNVYGVMTTSDGERAIDTSSGKGGLLWNSDPDITKPVLLAPVGMPNKSVGGGANGFQCGVTDAKGNQLKGLNNIGLLVRTWGKVKSVDSASRKIIIDDGSGTCVTCAIPWHTDLPPVEADVTVTGISSIDWVPIDPAGDPANVRPVPLIKIRDGYDFPYDYD